MFQLDLFEHPKRKALCNRGIRTIEDGIRAGNFNGFGLDAAWANVAPRRSERTAGMAFGAFQPAGKLKVGKDHSSILKSRLVGSCIFTRKGPIRK